MKFNVVLVFLLTAFVSVCFAQEEIEHVKLKNEGNDALRSKDYKKALESYEASMAVWPADETAEAAMIYNAADCARRINDDEKALKYYTQSQELGYRPDGSAYYRASSLKSLDREEEMEQLLIKSIAEFKTSSVLGHMKKMLVTYYLKQGADSYNNASQTLASAANADPKQYDEITKRANDFFAEAKPWFEKVLEYDANNQSAVASLKEISTRLSEK
ncbi:MAG: tetratricopeptide repeat protein [Cytophagaceae bacterium]|jgi:tetratricopeptide (TPR) repeat protein|nr:tetratricopeptide repeat protein [Cytophagaceae bacterium]